VFVSGMLVALPDGSGVGKLDHFDELQGVVSVFYSIVRSEVVRIPRNELYRATLSSQTRVYARVEDRLRVGRVVAYKGRNEDGLYQYEVKFPNGNFIDLYESDLHLRPWSSPDDPCEVLASGGAETQFLHDRRQAAMRPLTRLRSAAQGFTSLISAGIELAPHQIAAVRRVLSDPIQRYLLADEVGLGKTIEAGLIIRQHLIDDPAKKVLVAVPTHLISQWKEELETKIRLGQFSSSVTVCSHDALQAVSQSLDVLVVDEAHHLVGVSEGPLEASALRLKELAAKTPVLLLLSATPPLGNELRFLSLLNLLEPEAYRLDDLVDFRRKLESRREIGRLLLALDPEANGFVLRQRGSELQKLFPNDGFVSEAALQLIAATQKDRSELPKICGALKTHIADRYRINQRLIRSRRSDSQGWEFNARGPQDLLVPHVTVRSEPSSWVESLLPLLEEWRFAASDFIRGDSSKRNFIIPRYVEVLNAISLGPDALVRLVEENVKAPSFDDEPLILLALKAAAEEVGGDAGLSLMTECVKALIRDLRKDVPHPKVVVFSSSTVRAVQFVELLGKRCDGAEVFSFTNYQGHSKTVEKFLSPKLSAILVCDQGGEEGLNLASADAIVHLDVPFSAERMEQRIGRLDRFGRTHGIVRQSIFLAWDATDSPWRDWFNFLGEGLSIFNRPISDVQFLLSGIEREALGTFFDAEPGRLAGFVEATKVLLARERLTQDEQYALDRIAMAEEPVEEYLDAIETAEEDESALELGVDQWLVETLKLEKRPLQELGKDAFKLRANGDTLIPSHPWLRSFALDKDRPLTWKRRMATRHPEMTLLRPGTPVIDACERFTRWDDRGTAFMTWRTDTQWRGPEWLGFRLCFTIEPAMFLPDLLKPSSAELARARRAQRYFPVRSYLLHVDANGEEVNDPLLARIIRRPYKKAAQHGSLGADLNLASRPEILNTMIDPESFAALCRTIRDVVTSRLRGDEKLAVAIQRGVRLLEADIDRRRNRLIAENDVTNQDLGELELLLPAIGAPSVRLDAMGCFIVSNTPPMIGVECAS
jgi:ATP-dependent helicase HepA